MTTHQARTQFAPATIALPIADRQRSHLFYGEGLGFATPGELADDGVPEPLRVVVNDALRLMLIPTGGFGWVTAGSEVATRGTVECQGWRHRREPVRCGRLHARGARRGRTDTQRGAAAGLGLLRCLRRPRRPPVDGSCGAVLVS